jgi:hypothetical protein
MNKNMIYITNLKKERYNTITRKDNQDWKGWEVIDEMKAKPNFPDNLRDRKELLDDLEYSYNLSKLKTN